MSEGLVGEVMGLEVSPDRLDVVEFGRVLGQPFDGQPVRPGGQGGARALAGVDGTVVLDQHDRAGRASGLRAVEMIDLLEMGDEVAAAFGRAGMHDEPARMNDQATPVSRPFWPVPALARASPLPTSPRRGRDRDVSTPRSRRRREARCRLLRPAVCAVAGAGHPLHLAGDLASLQRVPGPPPAEVFFATPWTVAND